MSEEAPNGEQKKLKPWHMGLAIGFLMAIVFPLNKWILEQLGLVDTWVGMLVALPIMCISGLAMAVAWQKYL